MKLTKKNLPELKICVSLVPDRADPLSESEDILASVSGDDDDGNVDSCQLCGYGAQSPRPVGPHCHLDHILSRVRHQRYHTAASPSRLR